MSKKVHSVRLDNDDLAHLKWWAEANGVSQGEAIRQAIARLPRFVVQVTSPVPVPPGLCGHQSPTIAGANGRFCELRAGHDGWHEAGGMSWGIAVRDHRESA